MSLIPAAVEPYLIYAKVAAGLALAGIIAGTSWHLSGLSWAAKLDSYKTAVEAQQAAQLQAVATDYRKQLASAQAMAVRQQGVIDGLNKALSLPDPRVTDLGRRLLVAEAAASRPGSCGVPKTGTSAAANQGLPAAGPTGDAGAGRLLELTQAVFDGCKKDDDVLDAAIKLLP
jgi:hypothetical protein